MAADRPLPNTKTRNGLSSLVAMHSDDFDSESSASESGASDEEQGYCPNSSSVSLHSGDEQETSLSQYRKEMSRKFDAASSQWMLVRGNAMARHLSDPIFHRRLLPRERV